MEGEKRGGTQRRAEKMKNKLMEAWEWEGLEGTAGKSTNWMEGTEGRSLEMSPKGLSENVPRPEHPGAETPCAVCGKSACVYACRRRRFAAGRSVGR